MRKLRKRDKKSTLINESAKGLRRNTKSRNFAVEDAISYYEIHSISRLDAQEHILQVPYTQQVEADQKSRTLSCYPVDIQSEAMENT